MGLYLATFLCRTALGLLGGPGSQSLMLTSPRGHSHPPLLSLGEIFVSECWCQECLNPDLLPQVTANSDPLATPSWFIEQECCHAIFMDRAQQTSRAFVSLSLGSIAPGEASCHVMRTLVRCVCEEVLGAPAWSQLRFASYGGRHAGREYLAALSHQVT